VAGGKLTSELQYQSPRSLCIDIGRQTNRQPETNRQGVRLNDVQKHMRSVGKETVNDCYP